MSRIRIVGGKIIKTTGGDYNMYSKGNIVFNAAGAITETSDVGITFGEPKEAPKLKMTDVEVTKVEGPFDDERNLVKEVKVGESYMYKATPSRVPSDFELKLLKWAIKNDDKKAKPLSGVSFHNQLASDGTMPLNIRIADSTKATVFAYFNDINENSGVEVNLQSDGEIKENQKDTNIVITNKEGTKLNQIKHEFVSVGESIAQIKRTTSAGFTSSGTVFVSQFKSQVASRGEEVWAYKNEHATFEGTLEQAKTAFPDVDFSDLKKPFSEERNTPEFNRNISFPRYSPVKWETLNEFDAEKNGGKPTNWTAYLDATQTALDLIGLIPVAGEAADIISGTISLARGNYGDAALSFASAIPIAGTFIGGAKIIKKAVKAVGDNKGVYDLVVKNADDIQGYVGQSKDVVTRIKNHFSKAGKLSETVKQSAEIIHKMKGSTKLEREMYEQFVILEKYGGDITTKNSKEIHKLLNKVNPVGGRFDLMSKAGKDKFTEEAIKIAKKYNLPTSFDPF
ncbi:GIY-YIG nuclease family protein [Flavobacterium sp. ZT3R18]|uniref:GIY-YIG nuclease family protein n=1 Tax=Flavobacterium sp. ZT3R18 TaxID=2594429 RepID=UPI00117BCF5A|nr:GIY-YIG nuclease family protein [Flavobacterium sp. ZT3R18]TRX30286.1 GIY-YIG nuclease family protein [Flavobacterium sp. ZT3R18]